MKIPPLNIRAAIETTPPQLDFVLPGLLPQTVGTMVGSGGVGKTTLLLQLAMSLSSGSRTVDNVFPITNQPSRIVFVAAEESSSILRTRLHAIGESRKKGLGQASLLSPDVFEQELHLLEQNMVLIPAAGHSVSLLRNGEPTKFFEELCQFCRRARLIIIDPLRRLHDGDENSSSAMTQLVQLLECLAQKTGAAVIAAHHMGKGAAFAGITDLGAASRGSSALTDAVRWQVNLSGMSESEAKSFGLTSERKSYLRLDYAKANYVPPQPTIWLKRSEGGVLECSSLAPCRSPKASSSRKGPSEGRARSEVTYV